MDSRMMDDRHMDTREPAVLYLFCCLVKCIELAFSYSIWIILFIPALACLSLNVGCVKPVLGKRGNEETFPALAQRGNRPRMLTPL